MNPAKDAEVQVLVLGLCRTGTWSIRSAFQHLGYEKVYHMVEVIENPNHAPIWKKLTQRKLANETLTRADFEPVLKGYQVTTDFPPAVFAPELIKAYPNAKVILTTRTPQNWVTSMSKTIIAATRNSLTPTIMRLLSRDIQQIMDMATVFSYKIFPLEFTRDGESYYLQHNEEVRACMRDRPDTDFLEFEVKEGWGPLCRFLGVDVPQEEFPRKNDSEAFNLFVGKMYRRYWEPIARMVVGGGLVGVGGYLAYKWFV